MKVRVRLIDGHGRTVARVGRFLNYGLEVGINDLLLRGRLRSRQ
jgi:hypothetical protein